MSIATGTLGGETRIRFAGVGFDVYESLIRATPPRTVVRMAFDGKDLEIMVKGPVHDNYGRLLDRFITAIAAALGISHRGLGETTWIRPELERGLEADQCYVFDPAKLTVVHELLAPERTTSRPIPTPTWPWRSTSRVPRRTGRASTRRFRCPSSGGSTAKS